MSNPILISFPSPLDNEDMYNRLEWIKTLEKQVNLSSHIDYMKAKDMLFLIMEVFPTDISNLVMEYLVKEGSIIINYGRIKHTIKYLLLESFN